MTCKINADTSDGLKIVSDTSGAVDIQSNGVTKVSIDSSGNISTVAGVSTNNGNIAPLRPNVEPLIINGEAQINQRGDQTGQTADHFSVDRFGMQMGNFGTWSTSRSSDTPTGKGFANSLKLDCTTADTSLGAGDFGLVHYRFEGQHLQLLKKGTSDAEKVTVAFYVKSAKTGTYVLELYDVDNSRHISQTYTISSADTWEQKVLVFAGDTTGALGNDNGHSLAMSWWLGAGSTYNSATLQTSWGANDTDARATGVVNLADSTDNDWYITGVQFEIGEYTASTLPPFQHQMIEDTQRRCSRYFQKLASDNNQGIGEGFSSDGTGRGATMVPFLPMRASPTVTTSAASTFKFQQGVTTSGAGTGFILASVNNNQGANQGNAYGVGLFRVHIDVSVSGMAQDGRFCRGVSAGSSFVQVESEL